MLHSKKAKGCAPLEPQYRYQHCSGVTFIFCWLFLSIFLISHCSFAATIAGNSSSDSSNNGTSKNHSPANIDDRFKKERIIFLKAEMALQKKHNKSYKKYYSKLNKYPLQVYLKYQEYRQNLSRLSEKQILKFFKDYKDTPYEDRLRSAWLNNKAKNKQWQKYLNAYKPQSSISRQCAYLNALINTNNKAQAFKQIPKLWLVGKSQPKSCDPVFSAFKKAGKMTSKLVWARIKLSMKKGRTSLATYLAKSLNKTDQQWLNEWVKIYRKPERVLNSQLLTQKHAIKSTIQVHAVERLANKKPPAAIKLLAALEKKNHFSGSELDQMYRAIGMNLAYHHKKGAWFWLDKISPQNSDKTVQEWRVRSAIREENPNAINSAITRLPEEEQKNYRWQYWLASTQEQQGKTSEAQKNYYQLAQKRSYYGFLAADKMDMPYEFQHEPLVPDSKTLEKISQRPDILRAREFYLLGRTIDARREWYYATIKNMNKKERAIAAKLAQQWGWYDQAIITIAKTDQLNDIELRFPVLQKERVTKYSQKQQLQPAYTLAVIRRESAFATDARSRVGALGLMQIMPSTGKLIARKLKVKYRKKSQLLFPETNVNFGTKYLNMMLDKFDGQPALASAAYNAGGHRVKAWLPEDKTMSAVNWVETIPFKETRDYVSSILAYTAIYEHRLGLAQTRLSTLMPDIPKKK